MARKEEFERLFITRADAVDQKKGRLDVDRRVARLLIEAFVLGHVSLVPVAMSCEFYSTADRVCPDQPSSVFIPDIVVLKSAPTRCHSAVATVLTIHIAMNAVSCGRSPTSASPSPPSQAPIAPVSVEVSGTLWLHEAAGVRPYAGATLSGWLETASGRVAPLNLFVTDSIVTDSNGQYRFRVPVESRVRIYLMGRAYKPCAVTIDVTGDVTRDVHTVSDPRQLGARLPRDLLTQSPTLSGVVFEATSKGPRALSGAVVAVEYSPDGDYGIDVDNPPIASTLTDSEGRYMLCGLDSGPPPWRAGPTASVFVRAWKTGYLPFGSAVMLTGSATTLDIQLRSAAVAFARGPGLSTDRRLF